MVGDTISVVVPGEPIPKERPRFGRRGNVYTPKATEAYERGVGQCVMAALGRWKTVRRRNWPSDARFSVEITFARQSEKAADCDNIAKAIADAAQGPAGLWLNDEQIDRLLVIRCPGPHEKAYATIEVTVIRDGEPVQNAATRAKGKR